LEEFPDYILPPGITEEGWWNQDHEDMAGCAARAVRVAAALRKRSESEERITIVTHAGLNSMLVKALHNCLPGQGLWYHLHNAAISRVDFGETIQVRYLNRVDHLPPEMIT
jgi:2,3-bisphosphoglycerate-dependent phosphoglycerate mutase/probable phosphoglycerate mutase